MTDTTKEADIKNFAVRHKKRMDKLKICNASNFEYFYPKRNTVIEVGSVNGPVETRVIPGGPRLRICE